MKINGQYPKLQPQDRGVTKGQEKEIGKQVGIQAKGGQAIEKSESGEFAVNRVRNRIDSEADVDMDRVQALRAKIKKGEYQIDNIKLANRILKNSVLEDL